MVRFLLTWCAPRLCQVQGALAAAKLPTRGIPAGDQLAMRILGIILGSWRSLFVSIFPLARTCVYANDGSLADRCMTSASPTPDQLLRAQQLVFDVLLVTCDMFGDHVFIKETSKQIRLLNLRESCERLGLCASQVSTTSPCPASLRDGWKPFLLVVACLATILGPMAIRNGLVATCIVPKVRWVAPSIRPPPRALRMLCLRGALRGRFQRCGALRGSGLAV